MSNQTIVYAMNGMQCFHAQFIFIKISNYTVTAYRNCQLDDIHCGVPNFAPAKNGYSNDPCVPKEKKCDGYLDCRSGRDEDGCPGAKCRLDQFRCANGQKCIDNALKCNHKNDCDDGSDEQACSKSINRFVFQARNLIFVFPIRFSTVSRRSISVSKCFVYSCQFPL